MTLLSLYRIGKTGMLSEAGVLGKPVSIGKPDDEEDTDGLDTDDNSADLDSSADDEPDDEPDSDETTSPFASKSAPMPKATGGISISGDTATLNALSDALQDAAGSVSDSELSDWCEEAWQAIAQGIRRNEGSIKLPKFEMAPEGLEDEDNGEDY